MAPFDLQQPFHCGRTNHIHLEAPARASGNWRDVESALAEPAGDALGRPIVPARRCVPADPTAGHRDEGG
jgi:hypothetical protein